MRRQRRLEAALTLVELLVVLTLVSVLSSFLLVGLQHALAQARRSACQGGIRQLGLGATVYAGEHGRYWPLPDKHALPGNTMPHINYLRQHPDVGYAGGPAGLGDLYRNRYTAPELYYCPGHRNGKLSIDFTSGPDGDGNPGWRGWLGNPDPRWGHASTKANYLYRRRKGYTTSTNPSPEALSFRVDRDRGRGMIVDYPAYFSGSWSRVAVGTNHAAEGVNVGYVDASVRWFLSAGRMLARPDIMDSHATGAWWQELDK